MISIDLPYPPSVNALYDGGMKSKRRFTSKAYAEWKSKAAQAMSSAPMLDGPVRVTYTFTRPDKRKRDLGNLEKPVSDFLVKMSVIEDDCLIEEIKLKWGETAKGCRVEVEAA